MRVLGIVAITCLCLAALMTTSSCGQSGGGSCSGVLDHVAKMECGDCLEQNCLDEVAACYGPDWRDEKFAGTCAEFTACLCKCPSIHDSACAIECAPSQSRSCFTCETTFIQCRLDRCATPCEVLQPSDLGPPTDGGASSDL